MNLKAGVFAIEQQVADNPSILVLVACGLVAVMFLGSVASSSFLRRWKRWRRAARRRN